MFTDDEDDRADGSSDAGSRRSDETERVHAELAPIVAAAAGPSVTVDRLCGNEKYYPDCRPYLDDEFEPQHLVLLTTSGWAFRAEGSVWKGEYATGNTHTDLSASDGGVAICGKDELLVLVDETICSVPYAGIQGILSSLSRIELHTSGKNYVLDVARSAEKSEVFQAVEYLREAVRSTA